MGYPLRTLAVPHDDKCIYSPPLLYLWEQTLLRKGSRHHKTGFLNLWCSMSGGFTIGLPQGSCFCNSAFSFPPLPQMWNRWPLTGWPRTSTLWMMWTIGCLSATRTARPASLCWTRISTTLKASPWTRPWGWYHALLFLTWCCPWDLLVWMMSHGPNRHADQVEVFPPDWNPDRRRHRHVHVCSFRIQILTHWNMT